MKDRKHLGVANYMGGNIVVYPILEDSSGKLVLAKPAAVETAPGAGPRHMTWHPSKPWLYIINELSCTITSYTINDENGELNEINTVPTLPEGFTGDSLCSDIQILGNGQFLYGANRGDNSIVVCFIDQNNGRLKVIQHHPCGGDHPRNLAITPNNKFLLVANENDDNIVTLKIDGSTGKLSFTGIEAKISMPACVKFLP